MKDMIESTASFGFDGRHRYSLVRRWSADLPLLGWLMLNPSTATAEKDDPTISRCQGFARRWGYGGVRIANVWTLVATDPTELLAADDRFQPAGLWTLQESLHWVCGWGAFAERVPGWQHALSLTIRKLRMHATRIDCLGLTQGGHPKHPLYLRNDTPRIPFPGYAWMEKAERPQDARKETGS